jgi:predicted kinase
MEVDPTDQQGPVIAAAREAMRQHMRQGSTFAFNATNVTRAMRSRWIRLARDYNYRIRIVYIEPDLATIIKQNSQRPDPVPEPVVLKLLEKLDAPCTSEAHEVQLLHL